MTKEEIIEMAKKSGLVSSYKEYKDWIEAGPSGEELVIFAKHYIKLHPITRHLITRYYIQLHVHVITFYYTQLRAITCNYMIHVMACNNTI